MHFGTDTTQIIDTVSVQFCQTVLCTKPTDNPAYQKYIYASKRVTVYQCIYFIFTQFFRHIQTICDILRQLIIFLTIQNIVHEVVKKCDNVSGFIGNKFLPAFWHFRIYIAVCIGHKHGNDQFLQVWCVHRKAKLLLTQLPEIALYIILCKFCQIFVVCQAILCNKYTYHFIKRIGSRPAYCTHNTCQNIFFIKILYLKVIETLQSVFVTKELDVLFNHRLVFLVNT